MTNPFLGQSFGSRPRRRPAIQSIVLRPSDPPSVHAAAFDAHLKAKLATGMRRARALRETIYEMSEETHRGWLQMQQRPWQRS